jgi:putative addiction module component (TIGR02574 family)
MTTLALAIEKQARKLPAAERERLAERLLDQMEDERLTIVDEAWVAEAERRFSAWKRKKRKPTSAAKVVADIRKELRR